MLRLRAVLAGAAATAALVASTACPAAAAPAPRSEHWWFGTWGISKIWPITKGGGVTVAVLDSGVNANLHDLAGVVLPGGDTAGDGTDGRKDFDTEEDGHGTSMAALIAAQGTGPSGSVGLAPDSKILPVHVNEGVKGGVDIDAAFAAGILFATDHGARIINLSQRANGTTFPMHCPPNVQQAVAYAAQHDVVVVAATGNDGNSFNFPYYPAACAGVVAVGAVDSSARPWAKTQRQDYVTVAGPGVNLGIVGASGKYYPDARGTSGAAALTSGGLALVRAAHPEMSARTIVQRMVATANPTSPRGWNNQTGYGVFRIHRVMDTTAYPVPANAPNPVYQRLDQWIAQHGTSQTAGTTKQVAAKKTQGAPVAVIAAVVAALVLALAIVVVFAAKVIRRPRQSPGGLSSRPPAPTRKER